MGTDTAPGFIDLDLYVTFTWVGRIHQTDFEVRPS